MKSSNRKGIVILIIIKLTYGTLREPTLMFDKRVLPLSHRHTHKRDPFPLQLTCKWRPTLVLQCPERKSKGYEEGN